MREEFSPDTSPTLFDMEMYTEYAGFNFPTPSPVGMARSSKQTRPFGSLMDAVSHPLISSAAASPASPSAPQASDKATPTNAGYGPNLGASFAKLDRDGCWLRTCQGYFQREMGLDGEADSLAAFSQTWPRAGMMRNGIVSELLTSAPRISESASLSLPTPQAYSHGPESNQPGITKLDIEVRGMYPTPTARDHHDTGPNTNYEAIAKKSRLAGVVKMLPTPTEDDANNATRDSGSFQSLTRTTYQADPSGQLNADWVSLLMGFPTDWTIAADGSAESRE